MDVCGFSLHIERLKWFDHNTEQSAVMIPLFDGLSYAQAPAQQPPRWPYIREGLQINLRRVQDFYEIYPAAVESSHFLIRLLFSLATPMSLPVFRYADTAFANSKMLASSLGITSALAKGRLHEGIFYGPQCQEALLLDDDYFNPDWVHANWRKARPIRVLMHPKSDLSLIALNGKPYSSESGLAVISINIAMLAVMYRAFTLEQARKRISYSPYQFVGGWVLPGMLDSHLEVAVLNNLKAREQVALERRHSFRLVDYSPFVRKAMDQTLDRLKGSRRNFSSQLQSIPAVRYLNQRVALQLPDMYLTAQNAWALVASRLPVYEALLSFGEQSAAMTDRSTMQQLLRVCERYGVFATISEQLPSETSEHMLGVLKHIRFLVRG